IITQPIEITQFIFGQPLRPTEKISARAENSCIHQGEWRCDLLGGRDNARLAPSVCVCDDHQTAEDRPSRRYRRAQANEYRAHGDRLGSSPMIENDLLGPALDYAEAGIPVFPCEPDGKASATEGGYNDATTDPEQIKEWWGAGHQYNIGLHPADAGSIVLDIDPGKGVDRDLLARLPEIFTVETPRGGKDLYFESAAEHGNGAFDQNTEPPPQGEQPKAKKKGKSRFGGLSPSEGATLPPLTYWDEAKTVPRSNMGGCVGFLVGQFGSHKTGTAIMLALDAIQRKGARVLFIAAEDANGVAKTRLPAACKARCMGLEEIDPYWRTETETFDLLSETDRAELIEAYSHFGPDLIFIDVLTRVVSADINAPETGMRIMQAVYDLAAPFNATVVIAHHPGLSGSGRPMGSSLFMS